MEETKQQTMREESSSTTIKKPYMASTLTMKVFLSILEIGKNVKDNLERKISRKVEGKCIAEGYIIPHSVKVISYSAGRMNTENVEFQVAYRCEVCLPVEGMIIECSTKNIGKAGIHAEYIVDEVPIISIFVARDIHYDNAYFNSITKTGETIYVQVIGVRYELNDETITIIADLVNPKSNKVRGGGDDDDDDDEE